MPCSAANLITTNIIYRTHICLPATLKSASRLLLIASVATVCPTACSSCAKMGILSVTDDNRGLTVLLVNTYASQPAGEVQQAEGQLSLSLGDKQPVVQDLVPICQQLARLSSKSQQLLGADQAQQAQVSTVLLLLQLLQ